MHTDNDTVRLCYVPVLLANGSMSSGSDGESDICRTLIEEFDFIVIDENAIRENLGQSSIAITAQRMISEKLG